MVRIDNKIASMKDPLFDTFKDGKNDNLIQIRRAKLLLKGRESSFRSYVRGDRKIQNVLSNNQSIRNRSTAEKSYRIMTIE
jgi:hypothetical protein